MATTAIWKIEKRLDHVIDYIVDVEKTTNVYYGVSYKEYHNINQYKDFDYKTEKQYYTTGINCVLENAYEEMLLTKRAYCKEDKILGFHAFQSFKPGEVTPDIAHEIGVKLANELWGDRFEVVVSTHTNTNHVHNHFVINSVSFVDGLKYYDNDENYALMREISDSLCEEYGLSVLRKKDCIEGKIDYNNFYKNHVAKSNYLIITKEDIDRAILQAYSYEDFKRLLNKMGYEVMNRAGNISVRREPYKRNIRIKRAYGDEYSIDNINKRIIETHSVRVPFIEAYKIRKYTLKKKYKKIKYTGFKALYLYYCYLLKVFSKKRKFVKISDTMRADINKMEKINSEVKLLNANNIQTIEQLQSYKDELQKKLEILIDKREKLQYKVKKEKDINKKDEIIYEISDLLEKIRAIRKEIEFCEDIKSRSSIVKDEIKKIKENEDKIRKENDKNEHFR